MHDRPGLRILVVGDDERTVELLARLLRAEGYDVHTALGCRDALRVGLQFGCDLLISDIVLSDGDGCDLLRALCAYRPVHAIAMTGQADDSVIARAGRAGFTRVLTKPLVFGTVSEEVARAWGDATGRQGRAQERPSSSA